MLGDAYLQQGHLPIFANLTKYLLYKNKKDILFYFYTVKSNPPTHLEPICHQHFVLLIKKMGCKRGF